MTRTALSHGLDLPLYDFGEGHPMTPVRYRLAVELVTAYGLLDRDDPARARNGRQALEHLAESSGGVAYYPPAPEQAPGCAMDVTRQVRHVYTIGYAPLAQSLDGSYRKLRVVARGRERLWVKTRPGYRAARRVT